MSRRVFITGFGIITSIRNNAADNYKSLIERKHGFGPLYILETVHRQALAACEMKLNEQALCALAGVELHEGFTRTALLGLIALKESIQHAGLTPEEVKSSGLVSATTTGGIREFEKYYYQLMDPVLRGDFVKF